MAVSRDLFLAILSMDAYNRGYGAGLADGGPDDPDGLGGLGSQIGGATVTNQNISAEAQTAGFYGIAYQWNGETIISYRGTNGGSWEDFWDDAWNGYGVGGGSPAGRQAFLAAEFYQAVTGTGESDPSTGNVTLTGHSLAPDGGIAG